MDELRPAKASTEDRGTDPEDGGRRRFLKSASLVAMGAGLLSAYGTLGAFALRFLYPARPADRRWLFVMPADRLAVGESSLFRGPGGEAIHITRRRRDGGAGDFIALSSTCPHLGCQVHWQAADERYFCPCHNGIFDSEGRGIGGPPGDAGQSLPRYEVAVTGGLLYLRVALTDLAAGDAGRGGERRSTARSGCGPCRGQLGDRRG